MKCENCGSTNFKEEKGMVICVACGTTYDPSVVGHINLDEELREKEIRRLLDNKNRFGWTIRKEPELGILTDEEILKYAPDSIAAEKIRFKNATTITDKIRYNSGYQVIIMFALIFGGTGIFALLLNILT